MRKSFIFLILMFPGMSLLAQDYASLGFSSKVIHSFTQGDKASFNRSAISLVKCAIATYGLADVLKRVTAATDSLNITLRNGDVTSLSITELALAKSKCGFKLVGDESIFDQSILLYAILAKRAEISSDPLFSGCKDFKSALLFLHERNRSFSVISLVPLLGFDYIKVEPFSEISYVHQSSEGPVFACYKVCDKEGREHNSANQTNGKKHTDADIILANFIANASFDSRTK